MSCYVYAYKDGSGIIRYVGKGTGNRANEHISLAKAINEGRRKDRATYFTRWLAKCLREGKEFSIEVLQKDLTDEQAISLEIDLIATHKRKREGGTLYNTTQGGDGFTREDAKFFHNQPEMKLKKSAAMKKAFANPETRERMRLAHEEANRRPHRRLQAQEKAIVEWQRPERKAAAAQRAKELWADPIWSANRRSELVERNKSKKQTTESRA